MALSPIKKPPNLAYGVDETPPAAVTLLSGLQHVALISAYLVYPLLVFRSIGVPTELIANLLSVGFIVLGIGTFLQASSRGPVGSGYLCPTTFTAAFIGPSLIAVKLGGLPLLFGMTLFAGIVQSTLSRALHVLRPFLPTELSGFVVLMVGITAGTAGVRYMVGSTAAPSASAVEWSIVAVTLAVMAGLSVWATGLLKMICALVGLMIGYALAAMAGLVSEDAFASIAGARAFSFPGFSHVGWSFDAALIIPFSVAALATTLKAMGTVTLCQKMNDADWVRPDMRSNKKGVLADGLGIAVAGVMGSIGTNTSSANVALIAATGVASRRIAFAVGAMFIGLGLLPKFATLLAVMPRPVMAAALIFATCFLLINGMQIITSRMLDTRKTLVIGLATVAGLTVEVFPSVVAAAPGAIAPLLSSSLVFGTLVALALNLLFRIGIRQTVRLTIDPGSSWNTPIEDLFKRQGATWGARPDIIARAIFGTLQLVEAVAESCEPRGPLTLEVTFDEFNLDVFLRYQGDVLEFPERRPSNEEIRMSEAGMRRLAGFMLHRNADRVQAHVKDDMVAVHFHFDH